MNTPRSTTFRTLTGPLRARPDFLIIGAQRSGTTSLYSYLARHPGVVEARKKEITYFNRADRLQLGLNWYRSFFPLLSYKYSKVAGRAPITGEATPEYLFFPHAAKRVAKVLPDVKLIVLLRNPVTRAYSEYEINVRKQRESLSFEEALAKEEERTAREFEKMVTDESYFSQNCHVFSYRQRGLYAEQLQRWFEKFPRERFLILKSEEMFSQPQEVYAKVLQFLGLASWELPEFEKHNSAHRSKMNPATAASLADFYQPHNERLYKLIGRDMGWEKSTY